MYTNIPTEETIYVIGQQLYQLNEYANIVNEIKNFVGLLAMLFNRKTYNRGEKVDFTDTTPTHEIIWKPDM